MHIESLLVSKPLLATRCARCLHLLMSKSCAPAQYPSEPQVFLQQGFATVIQSSSQPCFAAKHLDLTLTLSRVVRRQNVEIKAICLHMVFFYPVLIRLRRS